MQIKLSMWRYPSRGLRGAVVLLTAAGWLAPGWAEVGPATEEPGPLVVDAAPDPVAADRTTAEALLDSVVELIEILDEHGLHFDPETLRRQTLESLIQAADPLGRFITEPEIEARDARLRGLAPDIGLRVRLVENGFEISDILEETPAADEELEPGDIVIGVNYSETDRMSLHRFLGKIREDSEDPVHLAVRRADGTTNDLSVARRLMKLPAIEVAEELPVNLAYLRVNNLTSGSGGEVVDQLYRWHEAERYGLVLDLRGAGGDDLESAARIASLYAEDGSMLFAYRDKDDHDEILHKADRPTRIGMPTMVLVDGGTSGAAEALAATLKDSVRGAMLFGQNTMGDLLIREARTLSTGERIHMATRKLVLADGTVYDGRSGVRPDVVVTREAAEPTPNMPRRDRRPTETPETIEHDRLIQRIRDDGALRRSIDVLLGLKALNIQSLGSSTHNGD